MEAVYSSRDGMGMGIISMGTVGDGDKICPRAALYFGTCHFIASKISLIPADISYHFSCL